jgi:hypothetical protein
MARRYVFRAPDIDLVTAVTCEVGGADNSGSYTRCKELPVPVGMVSIDDRARVVPTKHLTHAFPHSLIGLPITAGRQRVAGFPVIFVMVGVPRAGANALEKCRTDPVSFD